MRWIRFVDLQGGSSIAGLQQKQVPVTVVTIREKADYKLTGVSETDKAGRAKMLFMKSTSSAEMASVKVVDLKTGSVVSADSVSNGKQSTAEPRYRSL